MNQSISSNSMEQAISSNENERQGLVKRILSAVFNKSFNWLCQNNIGMSPYDSYKFMSYTGFGWEEAAYYQSLAQNKYDPEV